MNKRFNMIKILMGGGGLYFLIQNRSIDPNEEK